MSSSSDCDEFFDLDEQSGLKTSNSRSNADETIFLSPYASKLGSSDATISEDIGRDSPISHNPVIQINSLVAESNSANAESKPKEIELPEFMFKEPASKFKPRPTSLVDDARKGSLSEDQKCHEVEKRRRKLEDLRKRMLTDEDEGVGSTSGANGSPPGSRGSSLDGVYALSTSKHSHPFRIVEHDAVSLQSTISLGRVGRILGSNSSESGLKPASSKDNIKSSKESVQMEDKGSKISLVKLVETPQEEKRDVHMPDLVASTKRPPLALVFNPGQGRQEVVMRIELRDSPDKQTSEPVAPPRRKKRTKDSPTEGPSSGSLPSPASAAIESLAKDIASALDLKAAVKGAYVVKPQDNEANKAAPSDGEKVPLPGYADAARPSTSALEVPGYFDDGGHNRIRLSSTTLDDDGLLRQLNMLVRTRTDSGKPLSDLEILEQVTVLNLDTGERIALSVAEDKLPRCVNPLSLHIMRLTSEYVSNSSLEKEKESDDESVDMKKSRSDMPDEGDTASLRKKTSQLKKFLGSTMKKTVDKAKMIAQEVSHSRHKDREEVIDIPENSTGGDQHLKMKASHSHKGPYEFDTLQLVQEITGEHSGPIWCMKFSQCGRLLATAGQDRLLRIWVLRAAFPYFQDMRTKYNADTKVSPTPSQESLISQHSSEDPNLAGHMSEELSSLDHRAPFMPKPFCIYSGHTSDLLDVSWSKNYFILSSSMDKTVRLWHISRRECLCCFQHIDFVTAIAFHPRDDRYFLSGSLDGKLRLWNIPDKKVALWNELDGSTKLITAANFCQNGKVAVVGSYDGRCIFYTTEQLKYHTQIHVRSSRGKNAKGRKITGIEPMPGEDKILITSNDSRIRLYDLRDLSLSCKYKGCVNFSSQIKAGFSHDGKFIISGSENQCIYIWKTNHDYAKFSSARRDRNDFWEGVKAHNAVVTSAVFAPDPAIIFNHIETEKKRKEEEEQAKVEEKRTGPRTTLGGHGQSPRTTTTACSGYVIVSADFNGVVKVFLNRMKPKHSSLPASALA